MNRLCMLIEFSHPNCEIDNIGEIKKLEFVLNTSEFSETVKDKIFYKNALRVIKDVM